MRESPSPREIADRQLEAYNRQDLDAFCALFSADAIMTDLKTGAEIARGLDAIQALYGARFRDNPDLRCTVHHRMDLGDFAIDRETVSGLSGGPVEIIAIYEVRKGLIESVRFVRQAPADVPEDISARLR